MLGTVPTTPKSLEDYRPIIGDQHTDEIRMANPFSAVPTKFRVHARGRTYFANCAWDALGIPAALNASAGIQAACAQTGAPIGLNVQAGRVKDSGERVHFLVPFRYWYVDLVFT